MFFKNIIGQYCCVSANGDYCAFYHDDEFTILQDSYALKGKGYELTKEIALFLIGAMNVVLSPKYNWNNKSGWEKIRKEKILLPATEKEEIDWNYMEERIAELEQYLIVTGLNDYELTEEDRNALATKITGGGSQNSTSGSGCWKEAREFKISDLFELQKVTHKLAKEDLSDEYNYPAYSSDTNNNGIIGYSKQPEFLCDEKTPVYITFGDHTRTFNIARKNFSVLDNVKVLVPCYNDDKVLLYITGAWQKQIPNLGYSRHWKIAKDSSLLLPIKIDCNNNPIIDPEHKYHKDGYIPDWDYMEKYIRAIEKTVIADVVKYKNTMIKKTKEVVRKDK